MELDEALKCLKTYFEKHGWPEYIDKYKLWDRATLSDEHYKLGWVVVEIERHASFCGAQYIRGLPMSAFLTYWMRYAVNSENEEVVELPQRDGEVTIDIEAYVDDELSGEVYDFEIEIIEENKYKLFERVFEFEQIISSFDDAKECIPEYCSGFVHYFSDRLSDLSCYSEEEINKLVAEYKICIEGMIYKKIKRSWEHKDDVSKDY